MQRMMRCTVHAIPPIELLLAEIHKPLQLVRGILVRNTLQGKVPIPGIERRRSCTLCECT